MNEPTVQKGKRMNERLAKIKKELMNPDWTEELHHALEKMPVDQANQIIDTMSDQEVWSKVNNRRFQEDYIASYLEFLWEINPKAFWRQIKVTFDNVSGLLWGNDMLHFEILCENEIPEDVFFKILDFALSIEDATDQDYNAIGCVIAAQAKQFGGQKMIKRYLQQVPAERKTQSAERIEYLANCKCQYGFYDN